MKKATRFKINKFILLIVTFVLIISTLTACTAEEKVTSRYDLDVVDATSNFYVNDFAGIFSEEQKNSLMEKAVSFEKETYGIQVVITTVKSLDDAVIDYEIIVEDKEGKWLESKQADTTNNPKFTVEEVTYSMYKEYGIGKDDMGILILLSTGTGKGDGNIRIETGRQMQFYITDGLSGELLDNYAMEYLYNQQYAEGLISLQNAVIEEIKKQVPSDWYSKVSTDDNKVNSVITNVEAGKVDNNSGSNDSVAVKDNSETKGSGKGTVWGFLGSIFLAIASLVAFINQKFKSNAERQKLEKTKRTEVSALKDEYETKLIEKDDLHEKNIQSLRGDYQKLEREKDKKINSLKQMLNQADGEISTLTKELEVMKDKYERAQCLHPEINFDEEVLNMIEGEYKAKAQEIDNSLAKVLSIAPTKNNCKTFADAIELFDSTQSEVSKYVTSDKNTIILLYKQAVALKKEFERAEQEKRDKATALTACNEISRILNSNSSGNHKTYEALNSALSIFLNLSSAEKSFFPDNSLIEKLKKTHSAAKEDYRNYNAAHNAENEVRRIIGAIYSADEYDRDRLERANRYYKELTYSQQRYFSNELLSKLRLLISEADDDHRRKERQRREEAERRRVQSQRTTSYTHRSSSFGGHGGRPSGGGASRKF